jgi:pyruvate formate lyase activating enzyme
MKTSNLIFDIKRYAINDGPGIRTTIFLKGCPLRCVWCHNPESWSTEPQELFKQSKCIRCGTCLEPGFKVDDCPTMAREICGRTYTMEELMNEIEKERDIMEDSGGGVTLCGGEPLMHPSYSLEILKELGRRGFHRTVDTSLYAPQHVVEAIADECELFLADLKLMDSEKHRRYTGVDNELILQNIRYLADRQAQFSIRIPLVEGINADEENIEATAQFLASAIPHSSPITHPVHLLPYHDVGKDKHRRMGSSFNPKGYPMAAPSEETLQRCKHQLEAAGLQVIIGG